MGKDVISWESVVGLGRVLIINGETCGYIPIEINDKTTWLKGVGSFRRFVSFSELLGTYVGVVFCSPVRSCSKEIICIDVPIVTDNQRNDYIIKKKTIHPIGPILGR